MEQIKGECGHCDHQTGMVTMSLGYSDTSYRCCHCGRERVERRNMGVSTAIWSDCAEKHGPFRPWAKIQYGVSE
jgi:hypothetical protein